mgnify:CR=1 FL=1
MKLNTNISIENMVVIGTLLATVAISYGSIDTKLKIVQKEVELKANKELIEYKIAVIMKDIAEIKQTLREIKGDINGLHKWMGKLV